MTIQAIIDIIKPKLLIHYQTPVNTNIAYFIVEHVSGYSKSELLINIKKELSQNQVDNILNIVEKHCNENMPLQYLFKIEKFLNLELEVKAPVLIPRPETEEWVDNIITKLLTLKNKTINILDLCTGTGCIGLSIAYSLPQAHVYLTDISQIACDLARNNMSKNKINNCKIIESDLFDKLEAVEFDLIVTNPPYISEEDWKNLDPMVKQFEDYYALVADDNGLGIINKILESSKKYLKFNAAMFELNIPQLIIEFGHNQAYAVANIAKNNGFCNISINKDFANKDRTLFASINETRID